MTPAEWLSSTDPDAMLAAVRDRAADRKLLLFVCGAARLIWDRLGTFGRTAVPRVEEAADLDGTDEDRRAAVWAACESAGLPPLVTLVDSMFQEGEPITAAVRQFALILRAMQTLPAGGEEGRWSLLLAVAARMIGQPQPHPGQADLLRCVFGNPFAGDPPPPPKRTVREWFRGRESLPPVQPLAFDPAWRTTAAVDLARVIYHDRESDLMPILADALQDAGCADEAALGHCRGGGPHARGCWVVDQVLGKK
jgi:hypothetical protein